MLNIKKLSFAFGALTLVLALMLGACGPADADITTTQAVKGTGAADTTQYEGLEIETDASGERVTTIVKDANGNDKVYWVYVPKGDGSNPTDSSKPGGNGNSSTKPPQTVLGPKTDPSEAAKAMQTIMESFASKRYHIVCTMDESDGEVPTEIDIMVYDNNMRIAMPFDEKTTLSIGLFGNDVYMMNPATKTYTIVSKQMLKTLKVDLDSLDMGKLTDIFKSAFDAKSEPKVSTVSYQGKACQLYEFKNATGENVRVYLNGTTPVRVESVNADGSAGVKMTIAKFNPGVTQAEINPSASYTKKSLIGFMTDMGFSS